MRFSPRSTLWPVAVLAVLLSATPASADLPRHGCGGCELSGAGSSALVALCLLPLALRRRR